ncbi:MAG TPA: helix-turn-helix domain-containing protein [Steroidobacteraceae bacterium]|nr:helix-turn-helix domain-containing protein [Steroidobacteraceae bacterium]
MDAHEEPSPFCPYYHRAVELIGRRWTGAILRALLSDVERFSELTETIPGLSDRMLSERLKELESEGIVVRRVIPETPVRIEYHLTPKGRALGSVVTAVSGWAERWLPLDDRCQGQQTAEPSVHEIRAYAGMPLGPDSTEA